MKVVALWDYNGSHTVTWESVNEVHLADGSVDYLEIPINKDNSLDRDNVKYISNGNVKILSKEETYEYFKEESWDPFSVPKKYWR